MALNSIAGGPQTETDVPGADQQLLVSIARKDVGKLPEFLCSRKFSASASSASTSSMPPITAGIALLLHLLRPVPALVPVRRCAAGKARASSKLPITCHRILVKYLTYSYHNNS